VLDDTPVNQTLEETWIQKQKKVKDAAIDSYKWAIENGIAKEQARAVLPEGMTESRLYMNGTLRSWIHYIQLRSGNGTQKEHAEIARECACVVASVFPMINEYLTSDG
jgi:thymidylate synthase (FAD)